MDDRSVVAKRLREARELSGLSQKQLGIKAGLDEFSASPRINQYERGKRRRDLVWRDDRWDASVDAELGNGWGGYV